jgi:signal transduction histidine kinase
MTFDDDLLRFNQDKISLDKELVEAAILATQRLRDILQASSLDDLSRIKPEKFEVFEALSELPSYFYERKLKLVVAEKHNQTYLTGSKLLLQEALINLIKNAFEAYPRQRPGVVLLTAYRLPHSFEIEIVDFAPHKKGHAPIKPFGGLGLGLPFARKIIEGVFHGTLSLELFKTKGAYANVSIPLV